MTAAEIARALGGRRNGNQWVCRCPAHKDTYPSLSITEKNGQVLFHCHAGCSQDAVADALTAKGLWNAPAAAPYVAQENGRSSDLDGPAAPVAMSNTNGAHPPTPASFAGSSPPDAHPDLGAPDWRYEYTDAGGATVGYVYRWNAKGTKRKEIRPLCRNGTGWEWKAFPNPRPLYGLAELAAFPDKPVLVVEGEKTADAARDHVSDHVVVTWPGGTGAVQLADVAPLKGRAVVLWPDHDEPGRKAMAALAGRIEAARSIKAVCLPDWLPVGWDLADAVPADLNPVEIVAEAEPPQSDSSERLKLILFSQVKVDLSADYIVKNVVNLGDFSSVLGHPGSGKSFCTTHLGLHIADGRDWYGCRVRRFAVLYVAAEGQRRFAWRLEAARRQYNLPDDLPFSYITDVPDLLSQPGDCSLIIKRCEELKATFGLDVGFIAIDTLTRVAAGELNDSGVMTAYVANCSKIQAATGAALFSVHHLPKEGAGGKGGAGSGVFWRALDVQIDIECNPATKVRTAIVTKNRDGEEGRQFAFKLPKVVLGKDVDGDDATTCEFAKVDAVETPRASQVKLPATCAIAMAALRQAIEEGGQIPPASHHIPANARTVPAELWRRVAYARNISDGEQNAKRMAFNRAAGQLQARGLVGAWQDQVWPVRNEP